MPHIKNALIRYRIIDRCLRNKYAPYPSKSKLREACEEALYGSFDGVNICDSTIEKDMFAMKMEHDAPIKYSKRFGGYYYQDPNFTINDIPLTEEDLSAIKFAANTLMQFRDVNLFKQFGSAIDKIVDRVSIAANPEERDLAQFIQFESTVSIGGNEFLPILLEAIKLSVVVNFNYQSFISTEPPKQRNVLPLLLKEYRNRWYLISFDVDKQTTITYALDRMSALQVSQEQMKKPLGFDPDNFFIHTIGITVSPSDQVEFVQFKADHVAAKYLISQPLHHTQEVIKVGKNKTTFGMRVIVSEELIRSFLSYAGEIEVLHPENLRNIMAKRAKSLNQIYN